MECTCRTRVQLMTHGPWLIALAALLSGCAEDPLLSPALRMDWKCVSRDSNGNPFFGIHPDKDTALQRAQRECVLGSPFRLSCAAEPADCQQLK